MCETTYAHFKVKQSRVAYSSQRCWLCKRCWQRLYTSCILLPVHSNHSFGAIVCITAPVACVACLAVLQHCSVTHLLSNLWVC
jgi:hypothetical protein